MIQFIWWFFGFKRFFTAKMRKVVREVSQRFFVEWLFSFFGGFLGFQRGSVGELFTAARRGVIRNVLQRLFCKFGSVIAATCAPVHEDEFASA